MEEWDVWDAWDGEGLIGGVVDWLISLFGLFAYYHLTSFPSTWFSATKVFKTCITFYPFLLLLAF
jgi:hypothetical protein